MNYQTFRPVRLIAVFFMITGLSLGCTTVVVPVAVTDIAMTDADEDYGWLLGTTHLTRHAMDHTEKFKKMRMVDMKWGIEEDTTGKRFLIPRLPIDGSFAVKLPAGSYRVTGISFNNMRGEWHAALPAAFRIRSRACTSLGTWVLQMQTGFFSGWITREVFAEQGPIQGDSGGVHEERGCPTTVTLVESPVQRSIELDVHLHSF